MLRRLWFPSIFTSFPVIIGDILLKLLPKTGKQLQLIAEDLLEFLNEQTPEEGAMGSAVLADCIEYLEERTEKQVAAANAVVDEAQEREPEADIGWKRWMRKVWLFRRR